MPLINCELALVLTWSKNCAITSFAKRVITNTRQDAFRTSETFQITGIKLHVPVVTLSTKDNYKLLEQLKAGFKRTIKWNKYRSEMTNQTKNNNLNYLIDPAFTKVNKLSVLLFENKNDITSFSEYYAPNVQIKDFNVLIDIKSFFDVQQKITKKLLHKLLKCEETMITWQAIY